MGKWFESDGAAHFRNGFVTGILSAATIFAAFAAKCLG
jgi:hypothetical protein